MMSACFDSIVVFSLIWTFNESIQKFNKMVYEGKPYISAFKDLGHSLKLVYDFTMVIILSQYNQLIETWILQSTYRLCDN